MSEGSARMSVTGTRTGVKHAAPAEPVAPVARTTSARVKKLARLPRHVGIILDGNGRWATEKGLPRPVGHVRGVEAVRETISGALDYRVEVLSLFAFSVLNWRRPKDEVSGLMELFQHYLAQEAPRLIQEGVRVRLLGMKEGLPANIAAQLAQIEADSAGCERLTLNLAINYGGREELVCAMRGLANSVAEGRLAPDQINEGDLEERLFTYGLPPVDLLIRTAGERRISNFMLWQSAYAELLFMDELWPNFNRDTFEKALVDYAGRRRTFGGLVDRGTPGGKQSFS